VRCRYEVFLGGRLLKTTEMYNLSYASEAAEEPAAASGYIDGKYRWFVDDREVADDVAQSMLASGGAFTGQPFTGPPISDHRLVWLLVHAFCNDAVDVAYAVMSQVPERPRLVVERRSAGFTLRAEQ
jgi:hypothetical protein